MNFDYKILEDKFNKLPTETQLAMTSVSVANNIKDISDKNGLLLDQAATLFDLTSYVMLGLVPSSEFASTLSKEANIDMKKAVTVTQEINTQVFAKIRSSMQNIQESEKETVDQATTTPTPPTSAPQPVVSSWPQRPAQQSTQIDHSDLEKAGDFTIVSSGDNFSVPPPQQRQTFAPKSFTPARPITQPTPTPFVPTPITQKQTTSTPAIPLTPPAISTKQEPKTEPLADHLLNSFKPSTPNTPPSTPTPNIPPKIPTPNVPPKPKGPDMYREVV